MHCAIEVQRSVALHAEKLSTDTRVHHATLLLTCRTTLSAWDTLYSLDSACGTEILRMGHISCGSIKHMCSTAASYGLLTRKDAPSPVLCRDTAEFCSQQSLR